MFHDVEACKEPVQKIRENAGMRKAEERMKERETVVEVRERERALNVRKGRGKSK